MTARRLAAALAFSAMIAGLAWGQAAQKVELREAWQAGLSYEQETTSVSSAKVTTTLGGEKHTTETYFLQTEETLETVLVADGGEPVKVKRQYKEAFKRATNDRGDVEKTQSPLRDRTLTLQKDGGTTKIVEGGEGLPEDVVATITLGPNPLRKMFPDAPVAVGESWTRSAADVQQFMPVQGFRDGKATCTLKSIDTHLGQKCAIVDVTLTIDSVQGPTNSPTKMQAEGKAYFGIDKKIMIGIDLKGTISFQGTQAADGGVEAAFQGEGELEVHFARKVR